MTVDAAVRAFVIHRDRQCVASLLDKSHGTCRDKWGDPHLPTEIHKLTIDHVRTDPGGARRDDERHLVAMCWSANSEHWSAVTDNRRTVNAYLLGCSAGSR